MSCTSRGPVIRRVICVNAVIPESLELRIQLLSFTMINDLAVFIFKESQDTTFMFLDAPSVLKIAIRITRISIVNSDYSKLNSIVLFPLSVLHLDSQTFKGFRGSLEVDCCCVR
jgi:hypothetical protein